MLSSVCLSHPGIVPKQLNVGSRKQRRTIALSDTKDLGVIPMESPPQGRQIQVGDFWPVSHYISETVQEESIRKMINPLQTFSNGIWHNR